MNYLSTKLTDFVKPLQGACKYYYLCFITKRFCKEKQMPIKFANTLNFQVLQRQMDLELELLEGKEERKSVLGRLYMLSLSSQVGFTS